MKEELNKLMMEFIESCKTTESHKLKNVTCAPTFENFILWLDRKEYYME